MEMRGNSCFGFCGVEKGKKQIRRGKKSGTSYFHSNVLFLHFAFGGDGIIKIIIYESIIILEQLPVYQLIQHNEFFILIFSV